MTICLILTTDYFDLCLIRVVHYVEKSSSKKGVRSHFRVQSAAVDMTCSAHPCQAPEGICRGIRELAVLSGVEFLCQSRVDAVSAILRNTKDKKVFKNIHYLYSKGCVVRKI